MDTIFQAFRDLAKFKIVASIDTGDKTYDNLIVLFVMSIFTVAFSSDLLTRMRMMITVYYYRDLNDLATAEYLSVRLDKCPQEFIPVKRDVIVKLIIHLKDRCNYLYKKEHI